MSQGKLSFKTTKLKRQTNVKNITNNSVTNEKLESLRSSDVLSPGSKRKYVSSPESSSPASNPPRTGHTRSKRQEKRTRHTRAAPHPACKTLLHYLSTEKAENSEEKKLSAEQSKISESVKPTEEPAKSEPVTIGHANIEPANIEPAKIEPAKIEPATSEPSHSTNQCKKVDNEPCSSKEEPVTSDKATQNDAVATAKMFLRKMAAPREEPIEEKPRYRTTGGKMLAAALAKKREGVPAHKNEVIRALAARRELCHRKLSPQKVCDNAPSNASVDQMKKTPTKLTARERFSHLLKPTSPKIKPFKAITISSPTKSPRKDQPAGLILPETYKQLHDKFNTSDQVVNLLARRHETCTFQKLQKNVQEICRKRFSTADLSHVVGTYKEAYILAQCKGLSQIMNDRTIRDQYQLTIAFNYAETEDIKRCKTTDIFGLHPSINTNRKINFDEIDSNKITENERVTLEQSKEKHFHNQRGLISAELLERNRRFRHKLLKIVRAAHQVFLGSLVPVLKIDDAKLTRWHPEFDLNGLELPPTGDLPKPPVSSRMLSATEMLESIDSNKSFAPPGMQEAVDKNYQKVLLEKKEKQDQLKDIDPALVARIRAKEAKKIAQKMTRDPEKDKELAMVERLEPILRCLRVLYIGAGKGSLLLNDVTLDISSNPRINMTQPSVAEHIKLLMKISPTWLSIANLRKKQYLKLNRNIDTNIVLEAVKSRHDLLK